MWYLTKNNKQEGPFDEQAVAASVADGTISRDTLVWREGMSEWLPLHRTDLARLFPQHSGPPPVPKSLPVAGVEKFKDAVMDAWRAFKILASDPIAKMAQAFETLGQSRALSAGFMFGAVFALCALFGIYALVPEWIRPHGITGFLKLFLCALVPFIGLAGACFVGRKVFRGKGELGHDCFIAGVSLLPFGLVILLTGILGLGNIEITIVLTLFALCLMILLLFAGLSRICGLSERAATLAVPLMLISSSWFSKIIYTMIVKEYLP